MLCVRNFPVPQKFVEKRGGGGGGESIKSFRRKFFVSHCGKICGGILQ